MASSSHFLLNSHVPVFELGRSSQPCTVTQLALNCPVAKFEVAASMLKDTIQAEGEKQKHPCAHLVAGELRLDFSFSPHLLQQFVSFCLQQRGEIVTVCRDLSTSSFLLLQFRYHLLNIQNEIISHILNISVAIIITTLANNNILVLLDIECDFWHISDAVKYKV